MPNVFRKFRIDPYMMLLIATIGLATILPASGAAAIWVSKISYAAVSLLFFLYGAKLRLQAIADGIANWKLQVLIAFTTYVLFPLCGVLINLLGQRVLSEELAWGIIYLTILPSTVQSSIALVAVARGNVPGAICAASLSNLLAVFITPLFAMWILSSSGYAARADAIIGIFVQIMLPFFLGQLLRPLVGKLIERHKLLTSVVDRGSILLIVYSAFSAGIVAGVWSRIEPTALLFVIIIDVFLLLLVYVFIIFASRLARLSQCDSVSFVFCGMQKSLASGLPMAGILFAGRDISTLIIPLMIYHQMQLFVGAFLAQRYALRENPEAIVA